MTRRSSGDEVEAARVRRQQDQSADLGPLFNAPAPEPEPVAPVVTPAEERRAKARRIQDARWRRWIDAGKPVALQVLARDGSVTAETFRLAAESLPHVLPPSYGEDRTLSYLSAMFAEMVAEGHLQKRRRSDGSVVKAYSEQSRNEHVIYEPADRSMRRAS